MADARGALYVIACGSPRARKLTELVTRAQGRGWEVAVVATPQGATFVDAAELTELTGHPVRWEHRSHHDHEDPLPPADAILVCPATFNTVNKWAAGIADTYALSTITEAVGWDIPLVAAPALNSAQAAHPVFDRSVDQLRTMGVRVIYGPGEYEPGPPRTGGRSYDWDRPLDALEALHSTD